VQVSSSTPRECDVARAREHAPTTSYEATQLAASTSFAKIDHAATAVGARVIAERVASRGPESAVVHACSCLDHCRPHLYNDHSNLADLQTFSTHGYTLRSAFMNYDYREGANSGVSHS